MVKFTKEQIEWVRTAIDMGYDRHDFENLIQNEKKKGSLGNIKGDDLLDRDWET